MVRSRYAEGLAIRDRAMPLDEFPPEDRERIEGLASQDRIPPRFIEFHDDAGRVFAKIPSRAWFEWHWRRDRYPTDPEDRASTARRTRETVIARDGLTCRLCGEAVAPEEVHVDHIQPRSLGGSDELSNLQVTHALCNMRKGNRI